MKWRLRKSSTIKGFWGIEDEDAERKTICYLDEDIAELHIRLIENAPQMYELIKEAAEMNSIKFRQQKTLDKFAKLLKKIDD